jgi:serine/threonine protein kinase
MATPPSHLSFEEEIVASVSNPGDSGHAVGSARTELATAELFVDGRYRVVREIATGGMGTVVEAIHLHTGRAVALKRILEVETIRDELLARLAREANVLGAVSHPGVVEVLDAQLSVEGPSYLVMEKLVGRTLEGLLLARPRMPVAAVAVMGAAVASALAYVHERGFVHRDVKPANVFLARDRFRGELVKLIDFGLATVVDGDVPTPDLRQLTRTGETVGTPAYMAPEQLGGLAVDERADIYALAATLYESLTGVLPGGDSLAAVIERVTAGRPHRPVAELCEELSPRLSSTIDACLAPSRDARPPLAALRLALEEEAARGGAVELLGSAVEAEPTDSPIPLRRRRHPRFAFVTRFRVRLHDGTVLTGTTEELSPHGVQARLPATRVLEGPMRLEIALPSRRVYVDGDLRWCRAAGAWQVAGFALGTESTGALAEHVRELAIRYRADARGQ